MGKRFTRNIRSVENIEKQPKYTNEQNDLLSDDKHVYVRNKNEYHNLTNNVKSVNDETIDENGNVEIDTGVMEVNDQTPDNKGNVEIDTGVMKVNGKDPDEQGNIKVDSDVKQESVTLNVPSDFPTLDSAFHEIESNIYAIRASVYVNIEAGHQIREGVSLKSRDYRRVTIQSEDDIVEVADGFTGDILKGSDCYFPIFNVLVDMKSLGSFGLDLHENANATVEPHCGVINAGDDGAFVNRLSQLYAQEANFSGANRHGMFVDHANTVYARYVNLDNCEVGLCSTKGSKDQLWKLPMHPFKIVKKLFWQLKGVKLSV